MVCKKPHNGSISIYMCIYIYIYICPCRGPGPSRARVSTRPGFPPGPVPRQGRIHCRARVHRLAQVHRPGPASSPGPGPHRAWIPARPGSTTGPGNACSVSCPVLADNAMTSSIALLCPLVGHCQPMLAVLRASPLLLASAHLKEGGMIRHTC